uniref:Uncharacterized protein n=1 Tax=Arundo donax TaxID=35708 RepID=A0A0A8Z2I3_ARUDO
MLRWGSPPSSMQVKLLSELIITRLPPFLSSERVLLSCS